MLINCSAYEAGRKLAEISADEIHDYLQRPGCFVWVAIKDPQDEELAAMQRQFGLHELAVEDARHGHQRPKIEEYGDCLFVVLHLLELEGEEVHTGEVAIFVGPNYVLSARRDVGRGFTEVRTRSEREPELLSHGSGYVLYTLMDAVVDRYFPVLEAIEDQLDAIEQQIFDRPSGRANTQALYRIRRRLTHIKHSVAPLLEASHRLFGGRVPPICAGLQDYFRDIYDHLVRLDQSIDSQRDMVTTALSVNLALVTIQQNEVVKRLASYAALAAVPTMIAGIYGMNFVHMPELGWIGGYPFALALMAGIDGWLFYLFRKANWL